MSEGAEATATVIGGELFAIALFGVLIFMAGRVLTPAWPPLLVLAVIVPSAAQLLVRRLITFTSGTPTLWAVASISLGAYLFVALMAVISAWRWSRVGRTKATGLFTLLGLASFAAALPLGLLFYKSERIPVLLRELSALISLHGLPALVTGLFMWRRITRVKLVLSHS